MCQQSGKETAAVTPITPAMTIPAIPWERSDLAVGDEREVRNVDYTLDVINILLR